MHHMTKEHKMNELSFSDLVSGRVTQWTFRINLPASNETASPSHLFHYITAIDNRQDDASTDVSEISSDEYDGDVNEVHSSSDDEDDTSTDVSEISDDEYDEEFLPSLVEVHSRYDHRVIRDFSNSSDAEDDASTDV